MNHELPDVQAGFRKGRGTRDQIANIQWIIRKARQFQKNIYFCFIDYAIRVVSPVYLRLFIFLLAILIPACASFSPAFLMVYSAFKLNKQGDNIQPWRTPFPIWNQSVVPCPVLTVAHDHVHQVSDAIQPSHPLSSPSPPAFSLFQHQGPFQWVSSSH